MGEDQTTGKKKRQKETRGHETTQEKMKAEAKEKRQDKTGGVVMKWDERKGTDEAGKDRDSKRKGEGRGTNETAGEKMM